MGLKRQRPPKAKQTRGLVEAVQDPQRSPYFCGAGDRPARLGTEFFDQPAVTLARALLGQVLVRRLGDGTELRGRVVETEAYLGPEDEAAHSRGGRQTARNRGMFMRPGTLYVYLIYGMYFCLNVSSRGEQPAAWAHGAGAGPGQVPVSGWPGWRPPSKLSPGLRGWPGQEIPWQSLGWRGSRLCASTGAGACVLLRALEPLEGREDMRRLRGALRRGAAGRALKDRELCSGPSKLCQALAIDRGFDQRDLAGDEDVWLERGPPAPTEPAVVAAPRVGIGQAGEWTLKPLRFYVRGSPWVSVVDRAAEQDGQA
ncbi:DNA-3-methyladenine glycosylase [Galemys pyrenaicus]|uniref:DNA-3-methyladenine glycosylase II n=1 Tax=Galemys pyrenaicus TaxID=202257 RepID=A0A8J5ZXI6_GALPY|nr:DNA-3-methyladenine glycosylase [Galemys pyrenaicus]